MKHRHVVMGLLLIMICFASGAIAPAAGNASSPQHINAEPVAGKPGSYFVSMRFDAVEKVMLHAIPGRGNAGREAQELLPAEWRYDREHNLLIVSRPVDDGQYLLRLYGAYQLPLCVALSDQAKAGSFRVIVDGRIAEAERDYRVDQANGYVNLLACATGNEKFMIQYRTKNGACSVGSLSLGELTRPLLQYIGFPLEGNTRCADSEGRIFTALDNDVHDVWMVQLVPLADGYAGCDLRTGFRWNAALRQVVLDEPVDVKKYAVMVYGVLD